MVLVDTSIWVDHLRNRAALLGLWQGLPQVLKASHDEVLHYLQSQQLMGKGIGWVDLHLLTSVRLTPNAWLWTRDKRLQAVAQSVGSHWLLEH